MILVQPQGFCWKSRERSRPLSSFFFTQIRYRGGDWDPNPQFVEPIVESWSSDKHRGTQGAPDNNPLRS